MKQLSSPLFSSFFYVLLGASKALASGGDVSIRITITNPLKCASGGQGIGDCILPKIIDGLFILAIPIVTIMVLYGGFQIMTSGGDPEKFRSGRKTILYAAIGFIVIGLAKSVTFIIQNAFR